MNTLLHICCAPCANQCIDVLRTDGCAVTGYWYNPNIHPFRYRVRPTIKYSKHPFTADVKRQPCQ